MNYQLIKIIDLESGEVCLYERKVPQDIPRQHLSIAPALLDTLEGCAVPNSVRASALAAFRSMPHSTQHQMSFVPKSNTEMIERAEIWREALNLNAKPRERSCAMMSILSWYRHILAMREGCCS